MMPRSDLRRQIEPVDFRHKPALVLTIDSGSFKQLRNGERFAVIVFREASAVTGEALDLRLNETDMATLRRIYGSLRDAVGQWCVVEVRETGIVPLHVAAAARVRVAYPATWRRVLPEVMPVTFDAPLDTALGQPFPRTQPDDTPPQS